MKEEILVSIIIPVYKAEKYIRDCIESLINQTYKNLELIFVIDGITDNSKQIIEKYKEKDDRIVIIEKENTGAIDSRKEGLKIAKGKYIIFVDSDDWIKTETIQEMLDIALKYNADLVKAGIIKKKDNIETNIKITEKIEYITQKDFQKTIYKEILSSYKHNSMVMQLIKKNKINIDAIKEDFILGEDLNFNLDLYANIKDIVLLSKCYYYYRYNQESTTNKLDLNTLKKHLNDIFTLTDKEINLIKKWNIIDEKTIKDIYIYMLLRISMYSFKIFNLKDINKQDIKKYFEDIVNNKSLETIRKNITLEDISSIKNKSKFFMKLIYKGNVKSIVFIGKCIYKIYMLKVK